MSNKGLKITLVCIAVFVVVCLFAILHNNKPKDKPKEPEEVKDKHTQEESTVKYTEEGAPILGT